MASPVLNNTYRCKEKEQTAWFTALFDCCGTATAGKTEHNQASLPGDHRALEPPDPIPNSEVKQCIADGSVGSPHVRVGHRQAPNAKGRIRQGAAFFLAAPAHCLVSQ